MRQTVRKRFKWMIITWKISNPNPVLRQIDGCSTPARIEQAFVALMCCEGAWYYKTQCTGIHPCEKLIQMNIHGDKEIPA